MSSHRSAGATIRRQPNRCCSNTESGKKGHLAAASLSFQIGGQIASATARDFTLRNAAYPSPTHPSTIIAQVDAQEFWTSSRRRRHPASYERFL
jgi:hypothetical protein